VCRANLGGCVGKFAKLIQINAEISSETDAISTKITKMGKSQKYIEKNIGLDIIE
jgi:hypothetical protein